MQVLCYMTLIVTHNGKFHTDDVFAVAILKKIYKDAIVWRTRDEAMIAQADIVVDVGQVYDPKTHRYDHHQKEGSGVRENGIPYAACGLVWKHFGNEIVKDDVVWRDVDENIIQPIDAHDNGVKLFEKMTVVNPLQVISIIQGFLPNWDEELDYDSAFMRAVDQATSILDNAIKYYASRKKAFTLVEADIQEQKNDPVLVLSTRCPWMDVVAKYQHIRLVVFQNSGGLWSVWCAKDDPLSFDGRIQFPHSWGGLSDGALVAVTGVADAVFCHRALFSVVAKSKEGAITMARLAIANDESRSQSE